MFSKRCCDTRLNCLTPRVFVARSRDDRNRPDHVGPDMRTSDPLRRAALEEVWVGLDLEQTAAYLGRSGHLVQLSPVIAEQASSGHWRHPSRAGSRKRPLRRRKSIRCTYARRLHIWQCQGSLSRRVAGSRQQEECPERLCSQSPQAVLGIGRPKNSKECGKSRCTRHRRTKSAGNEAYRSNGVVVSSEVQRIVGSRPPRTRVVGIIPRDVVQSSGLWVGWFRDRSRHQRPLESPATSALQATDRRAPTGFPPEGLLAMRPVARQILRSQESYPHLTRIPPRAPGQP